MADQVPPCDIPAERAVVSACLISSDSFGLVRDLLKPEQFFDMRCRLVFEAAMRVEDTGSTPDIVTLACALKDAGRLEQIGGTPALMDLLDATPSLANLEDHCAIVSDKARLRRIITVSRQHLSMAFGDVGSVDEFCATVEREVFDATDSGATADAPQTVGELLAVEMPKILERQKQADYPEGVVVSVGTPTGLAELDVALNGGMDNNLYITAGRPGMGKTALAGCFALNIAKTGKAVVFFSLEMPKDQLAMRFLSQESGVNYQKIRTGRMYAQEWEAVQEAAERLSTYPISIEFRPGAHVSEVRSVCRREFARLRRKFGVEPGFIVVDYIGLLSGNQNGTREQEVASVTRALTMLTGPKGFRCPVMALSQLNRQLENRPDKRPNLSDLRESGAIEQDAYCVFFVYRDEVYHEESLDKGVAELIIPKNRNGAVGTVQARFVKECARFESVNAKLARDCDDLDAAIDAQRGLFGGHG